jgi:cold shock CspA family protein
MHGTMLWFNQLKDLGVITTEDDERLSVDGSDFADGERPRERCAGAVVSFEVAGHDEERKATGVRFVPELAPRRARMRHARYRSHG